MSALITPLPSRQGQGNLGQRKWRSETGITCFSKSQGNNRPRSCEPEGFLSGSRESSQVYAHISNQAESSYTGGEPQGTAECLCVLGGGAVPVNRLMWGEGGETKRNKMVAH